MEKGIDAIISRLMIDGMYCHTTMPSLIRPLNVKESSGLDLVIPEWFRARAGRDLKKPSIVLSDDRERVIFTIPDGVFHQGEGLESYEELYKAFANVVDWNILSKANHFSHSVGTSGCDLKESDFLQAICSLESGGAVGPYCAVLHPIQVFDLRSSLALSSNTLKPPSAPAGDLGAFASLHNVDIFKTTACPSVNTGADRMGAMMPMGDKSGLASGMKVAGSVTSRRDDELKAAVIEIDVTFRSECVNTSASGGVAIITDHE